LPILPLHPPARLFLPPLAPPLPALTRSGCITNALNPSLGPVACRPAPRAAPAPTNTARSVFQQMRTHTLCPSPPQRFMEDKVWVRAFACMTQAHITDTYTRVDLCVPAGGKHVQTRMQHTGPRCGALCTQHAHALHTARTRWLTSHAIRQGSRSRVAATDGLLNRFHHPVVPATRGLPGVSGVCRRRVAEGAATGKGRGIRVAL